MEDVKISVIVPVYNAEKYLSGCISSVLNQTYPHFELLLIVDGATDKSAEICADFASRDARIKVTVKENEGVSATRNLGIQKASGDYICFIDADDTVSENYLEALLAKAQETGADLTFCHYAYQRGTELVPSGEAVFPSYEREKDSLFESYVRSFFRISRASYIMGSACRCLIKRSLVAENSIRFPPCKLYEDQLFMLSVMGKATRIEAVNIPMYFYNDMDANSAVRKPYKKNLPEDQRIYLKELALRLQTLPLTEKEKQLVSDYALLSARKLLLTNAAMAPDAEQQHKEIAAIKSSDLYERKIRFCVYLDWLLSQPVKTMAAEVLIQLGLFDLLKKIRRA